MTLAWQWLRLDARRRAAQLVLLAVLVALSTGALLTALDSARRADTAVDRLVARTLPATAVVRTNTNGEIDYWPMIRDLPSVAAVSTFPGYSGFSVDGSAQDPVQAYLPLDDDAMRTVERPVVLRGRLADPARPDEAVVTEGFVRDTGQDVGDVVTVRLFSDFQVDTGISGVHTTVRPAPDGPIVRTRVVGVVRSPWLRDETGRPGRLFPSQALAQTYERNVLGANRDGEKWGLVRLVHGDADLGAFRAQLAAAGVGFADVSPRTPVLQHLRDVTRFEAACALGLAGSVLLAAVVVVGTAVSRQTAALLDDVRLLGALGAAHRQAILVGSLGTAVAGVLGTLAGLLVAVAVSPWNSFGVAATLEPDPGPHADPLLLGVGTLLVGSAVVGWSVLSCVLSLARRPDPAGRRSVVAVAASRARLPLAVAVGVRHALEPGPGRAPVRTALAGAVVGVLGVSAAVTFGAAIDAARSAPERFGQGYQLVLALGMLGEDDEISDVAGAMQVVRADPDVTSAVDVLLAPVQLPALSSAPGADRTLTVYATAPAHMTVLRGDPATDPGQVVLGRATARRLGVDVGGRVRLSGERGTVDAVVSGVGFVPQTSYNEYDTGAWVSPEGFWRLNRAFLNREALITVRPGRDPVAVAARLRSVMAPLRSSEFLFLDTAVPIPRQLELANLRVLPIALGGFLGLLALAATAHALLVSARRRRGEFAVLRALGMTGRQVRAVAAFQAGVMWLVGLAAGLPIGVAVGRMSWRLVSDVTPLVYRAAAAPLATGLVVGGSLLLVLLPALPAGRRAARMRLADVLRAE
ncbi:ABC transporter permease [Spongisporangium articulatum]|uniref:ABC transporter permease n=1 Tax=Spongisporangium articulatum TaxID=3362603 RepID=A0ABW8AMF6_9ACTN